MRVRNLLCAALGLLPALIVTNVSAFNADGHRTVGAIADRLVAGSNAAAQVKELLGNLRLQDAALWADCAKGVDPAQDYAYVASGRFPECKIFETPGGEAEMSDFVRRNDNNCPRKPTEETCHKQYHYSDVAIQRDRYALGSVGTRDDDIVAAVAAMTRVLQGEAAPAPFDIKDKREALLLLTHYVGDIHQPLHVAAVYLDANGARVDPEASALDPATETRGGNQIITIDPVTKKRGKNFHRVWDEVPTTLMVTRVNAAWVKRARAIPSTEGDVLAWPAVWATQTLGQAKGAFGGLRFGKLKGTTWTVTLPRTYDSKMSGIKQQQLTAAGARLARILQTVWP